MRPDLSNWQNGHTYDFLENLNVGGYAWECLRRNREYQDDYALSVALPDKALPLNVGFKWGLSFLR